MIEVKSLGKFEISDRETIIDDEKIRSDMLEKLLLYLLIHRGQNMSIEEISYALWQEDETDNPAGALKNLMYRLRTLLKKYFGDEKYIVTSRGAYGWNPDIQVKIDAEEMEALNERVKNTTDKTEKIQLYEEIMELYQGEFMGKIRDMHWIITLSTYYHSMFLNCIKGLAALYQQEEHYEDLEKVATVGIQTDSVDEELYGFQMVAFMKNGKMQMAMDAYDKAKKTLYEELGVRNVKYLEQIHTDLLQMNKGVEAEDMVQVQKNMEEDAAEGAFFCGYPVFREIYRLESRKIARLGEAAYVLLLTLQAENEQQLEEYRMKHAMGKIERVIKKSLRIGDVAARYSDSQYIIMLPNCNYESSTMVAKRIVSRFHEKALNLEQIKVKVDFEEIEAQ